MLPAPRPPAAGPLIALLVLASLAGAGPAAAAFLGDPVPQAPYRTFRHGIDTDRTVRQVLSSRWTSPLTFRNIRLVARETYGLMRVGDILVNVSALFGISKADLDFGTVDMQDGGTFWSTYAPGTGAVGSRRDLSFGDTYGSSWGIQGQARLLKFKGHEVAAGLQTLYSQSTDTGLPAMRLRYNEWDLFVGTNWQERFVSFYGGLDASWLVGELQLPDRATDLDQSSIIGIYGGFKMRFYRHLRFASELRLINQASYSLQLSYVF